MVDQFDRAQELDAQHLADSLVAQQRRAGQLSGPALSHCADCGDEIPFARRVAVPGCRLCIDCQTLREKQTGYRHGK